MKRPGEENGMKLDRTGSMPTYNKERPLMKGILPLLPAPVTVIVNSEHIIRGTSGPVQVTVLDHLNLIALFYTLL